MSFDCFTVYVGFWRRLGATLLDVLLLAILAGVLAHLLRPALALYPGSGAPANDAVSALTAALSTQHGAVRELGQAALHFVLTVVCWTKWMATPGKLLVGGCVVDARTGQPVRTVQAIVRYLGYFVSLLPLGLGFAWMAWHPRKQGFHDLLARTVVVRDVDELATAPVEELARGYR